MKLYKKSLHSLEDLKRERYKLKYAQAQQKGDDLFSLEGFSLGKKKSLANDESGSASDLLGIATSLIGSKSLLDGLLKAGKPALNLVVRKKSANKAVAKILWEFAGGYLKWKAVEVGIWGIKQVLKSRKEKKRFEAEASLHNPTRPDYYKGKKGRKGPVVAKKSRVSAASY